jgi:hypothetical protein
MRYAVILDGVTSKRRRELVSAYAFIRPPAATVLGKEDPEL